MNKQKLFQGKNTLIIKQITIGWSGSVQ